MRGTRMTRSSGRLLVATTCALMLLTSGCGEALSDKYVIHDDPVTLAEVAGSELQEVTLTERAAERLGVTVAEVSSRGDDLVVPSGALWLDIKGVFWVYTNPEPNTFLRYPVTVEDDDGRTATLSAGPPAGTRVVTVGVPELFGAEVGVGK